MSSHTEVFRRFWKKNARKGLRASDNAPKWARIRTSMQEAFPTYYETNPDSFTADVTYAIGKLNQMKPAEGGPAYIGDNPSVPNYTDVGNAVIAEEFGNLYGVIDDAVDLFDGMPHWNHPLTMCNVIPPANKAGIIGAMLTNVFSPNIIEGEYAWNVMKAEMETGAMMAKLIGWDPAVAGGLYTYGGSGCYLYGVKYALSKVLGHDSRCNGVRTDGKILVSQQGHYAKLNSTDWLGLGMNHIVDIETDEDTNAMDMDDLEQNMIELQEAGTPVIAIICTMGTTDAFAIDPVDKVRELINRHPNPPGFEPPFLYCDAVIGWSWLMFKDYDYIGNPLGFHQDVLPLIRNNYRKISKVMDADAIGIDFHKTGWAPYNCSFVMMKDLNDFRGLMTRPGSAYLQERTCYNPGLFTLEVSRSGSYAMAGWSTLKYLGREGFQSILGGILEVEKYFRDRIKEEDDMVCVNEPDHGFVTLFRVYPAGVNAEEQYTRELEEESAKPQLVTSNKFQADVANYLWDWFRSGEQDDGLYGPYTSYTSGFRPTDYNVDFSDPEAVIYAIKSFPMNVNVTAETMDQLIIMVRKAMAHVTSLYREPKKEAEEAENCAPPYSVEIPNRECTEEGTPAEAQVQSLVSGIGRRRKVRKGKKRP